MKSRLETCFLLEDEHVVNVWSYCATCFNIYNEMATFLLTLAYIFYH